MKSIYLLTIILFACNNFNQNKEASLKYPIKNIHEEKTCSIDYNSQLDTYSKTFEPKSIDLNQSISKPLDSFLLHVDTNCLRQQKQYQNFITTILAKLYYHHLKCCNQGYDLQSMAKGGAKIIIDDFERIAGYRERRLEMLNSGTVVDYIEQHPY